MPYWAAARAQPKREAVAQHFLELAGFTVYLPRLRDHRIKGARQIETRPVLFPGYLFCKIVAGWWEAQWCPGTRGLVMNSGVPCHVPDSVIREIKQRERNGLVELPKLGLKPGDKVRILHGPFTDHVGLYQGMRPRERVEVLLAILGGAHRVTLAADAVERA